MSYVRQFFPPFVHHASLHAIDFSDECPRTAIAHSSTTRPRIPHGFSERSPNQKRKNVYAVHATGVNSAFDSALYHVVCTITTYSRDTIQSPRAPIQLRLRGRRTNMTCRRVITGPIVGVHLSFALATRSFRGDRVRTRISARRTTFYALTTSRRPVTPAPTTN